MKKIPSLFVRDHGAKQPSYVHDEITPGCEWVANGEGIATRKWDGSACLVRDGKLFKRYEVRPGNSIPSDFEAAGDPDPITGKIVGWRPVGDGPEDRWHREAFAKGEFVVWERGGEKCPNGFPDGTYELCGPKINAGREGFAEHYLVKHGGHVLAIKEGDPPRDFAGLRAWLAEHDVEGIVWHHPDGRMAKIKGKDFGVKRPIQFC